MKKLWNFFVNSDFLKSTSMLFVVNIMAAVFNYALIVVVNNSFKSTAEWTSINSWLQILTLPVLGILTELTRKTSSLSQTDNSKAFDYYYFLLDFIKTKIVWIAFCIPFLSIVFAYFVGQNYLISLLIFVHILLQIILGLNTQFLLGLLRLPGYILSTLTLAFSRFILSFVFIKMGLGEFSLLLGWLFSSVIAFLISDYFLKKLVKESGYQKHNPSSEINLLAEIKLMLKSVFSILLLSSFFYIYPILANRLTNYGTSEKFINADLYSMIFNFGGILHFGAVSFLGVLVAFGAKGKNLRIFLVSTGLISSVTIFGTAFFYLIYPFLLKIFDRTDYASNFPEVLLACLLIFFYNLMYLSVQYLISQKYYKANYILLVPMILLIVVQLNLPLYYNHIFNILEISKIQAFLSINVLITAISSLVLYGIVILHNFKKSSSILTTK